MSAPENPIPIPATIPEPPTVAPVPDPGRYLDENPSWGIWEIIGLVVTTIVAMAIFLLGIVRFGHGQFSAAEIAAGGQSFAYVLVVIVMYVIVASRNHGRVLEAIRWNWPKNWGTYFLAGIVLDLCLVPFAYLLPMPTHAPIDDLFRTAHDAYVLSFFGVLCAPLVEELFFRGFLYPLLARYLRMIPAIVITSLLFASIHVPQLKSWGPVLVIFLVGLTLTTVRAVKKSVAATVLIHVAYNFALFLAAYIATSGFRHMEKFNQ